LKHFSLGRGDISRIFSTGSGDDAGGAENGVSLLPLQSMEEDGQFLGTSIQKWLDEEFIPQAIHEKLGAKVKSVYLTARSEGINDLGQMLLEVGTELEMFDMEDAFVNGWDVANKVSDLLMVRLDRELCECMGDLSSFIEDSKSINSNSGTNIAVNQVNSVPMMIPTNKKYLEGNLSKETAHHVRQTMRQLANEFDRFKLLRDFMDDEVEWEDMHAAIGLAFGFRLQELSIDTIPATSTTTITTTTSTSVSGTSTGSGASDVPNAITAVADTAGTASSSTAATNVAMFGRVGGLDSTYIFVQDVDVAPYRWEGLTQVPDVGNLDDVELQRRMAADLPEDEGATDIVMESLAGIEVYSRMKKDDNALIQRRILLAKWLYIQGFLNNNFPLKEKFVPFHLLDDYEDELGL